MILIIILSQLVTIGCLITIYTYRCNTFKTMFGLLTTGLSLALLPNFLTSLFLYTGYITDLQSQIEFGITGFIASVFIYYALKDVPCS